MGGTASSSAGAAPPGAKPDNDAPPQSESKCPVDHSKLSKKQLAGFMHPFSSRPAQDAQGEASNPPADASASACPVDRSNLSKSQLAALTKHAVNGAAPAAPSGAPEAPPKTSQNAAGSKGVAYDVYGQKINPDNLMPATPNQLPSPGQAAALSTAREASSIPKAGAGEGATWTYPSPQMFFNSLVRKGKAADVREADMDSVVAVHNTMNERTWAEVAAWERRFHCDECQTPKLKRFEGRPHDMSPAARFRVWFRGYPPPFDRHDWIVDRCGIADARYVIDYYYREQDGGDPIEIHVRPALDSPAALWDRVRAATLTPSVAPVPAPAAPAAALPPPPAPPELARDAVPGDEYEMLRALTPAGVERVSDAVRADCAALGEGLRKCRDAGGECEDANVSLNYCMARHICRPAADRFMHALENKGDEVAAYEGMAACLDRFHIMARRVMMHAAGITQHGPEFPAVHAPASAAEDA